MLKLSQLKLDGMDKPITARLKKALETHATIRTAADLSRAAKVTEPTISNWLSNKIQEDQGKGLIGIKLSRALGIRVEWLFTGEGVMHSNEGNPLPTHTMLDPNMVMGAYRVLRQMYGIDNNEPLHLIEHDDVAARFVQLYSMRESIRSHQPSQRGTKEDPRIQTTDEQQGMQTNGRRNNDTQTHGASAKKMAGRTGRKTKA